MKGYEFTTLVMAVVTGMTLVTGSWVIATEGYQGVFFIIIGIGLFIMSYNKFESDLKERMEQPKR